MRASRRIWPRYTVLYHYRLAARIYAKLVATGAAGPFTIELWEPYVSDEVKRIRIVGYQKDEEVFKRIVTIEKYLFANHLDAR